MTHTKDEALKLALDALEESVDLVREDYENAKKLYGNYPSRQARLLGMEDGLLKHEAAITAIKQARSAQVQEPALVIYQGEIAKSNLPKGFTGMLYTTPPAAQRQWVGLTDEEIAQVVGEEIYIVYLPHFRAIEAKLKEKNEM
jgi:hypothetical protein